MLLTKVFLGFSVLLWLPYGVFCIFQPTYLGEVAGVVASTSTGTTEIRAMYGGLEAGLGALCALALVRPAFTSHALVAVCFLSAGLFLARFIGFVIDDSGSGYTYGTLVFEAANATVAGLLARRA